MITFSAPIAGGDYASGGAASRGLKAVLVEARVDPEAVRRIMIAAYEAEMNVVIHAESGSLSAVVSKHAAIVEVVDEGPGIADLELAMQPGFSTAPPSAKAIGFGAGLGLPNIKKHVDDLRLESRPGRGTRLSFLVRHAARVGASSRPPSAFVEGLGAAVVARPAVCVATSGGPDEGATKNTEGRSA